MAFTGQSLRHPVSLAGVVITTASAAGFLALGAAAALDVFDSPYAGLVIYVTLPALFLFGLLLIPLGIWLRRRALRRDPDANVDWPVIDLRAPRVRRTVFVLAALTAVNAAILLVAGYSALHWMESPSFCGQACHTPMHPQFTSWQNTPHSNIACVQCHIGEGGKALVHYKLAGVRQLIHVLDGNYPRPIPASQADMRPALQTCGRCHAATLGHGERQRLVKEYAEDEANSETVTDLLLHVGGPAQPTSSGRAIHWHADPAVRVEYVATDADRQVIPVVRATGADGKTREYRVEGTTAESLARGTTRVMDCIDCHNTAAHRIAPTAEQAVDRALGAGQIDRRLPFVRREGVRLLKASYQTGDAASAAIATELRSFYKAQPRQVDGGALERSIDRLQGLYRSNVFPEMKVTWGVYKDNLGHLTSDGCFRCHDGNHTASDGTAISADCEYCHQQR